MSKPTIVEMPDYKANTKNRRGGTEIYVTRPVDEPKNICYFEGYGRDNGTLYVVKYYDSTTKDAPKKPTDQSYEIRLAHGVTITIRIVECTNMDGLLETMMTFISTAQIHKVERDKDGFMILRPTKQFQKKMARIKGEDDGIIRFPRIHLDTNYHSDMDILAKNIKENDEEIIGIINGISLWGQRVGVYYRPQSHSYISGYSDKIRRLIGICSLAEITDLFDKLEIPDDIYGPFMDELSDLFKKRKNSTDIQLVDRNADWYDF